MSQPYHYSFNPFALWRLKIFLRKNRLLLDFLVGGAVLALGILLIKLVFLPIEDMRVLGEPSFEDPKTFSVDRPLTIDINKYFPVFRNNYRMLPAIDPAGALCPVAHHSSNALGESVAYSIFNLKSDKLIFLAAFEKGMATRPFYRPRQDELIMVNCGARDSWLLRLCHMWNFVAKVVEPKPVSVLHRFDATSGIHLGQLEIPFYLIPQDISPNGRYLLASRGGLVLALIDLDSGKHQSLPLFHEWAFFESDDTIIVCSNKSVFRYYLESGNYSLPLGLPVAYYHAPESAHYPVARRINKLYFLTSSGVPGVEGVSCLHLGKEIGFQYWPFPYYGASHFQPEREITMDAAAIQTSRHTGRMTWVVRDFKTGENLKSFSEHEGDILPEEVGFLNSDYLWCRTGRRIKLVKIDELLNESFKFASGRQRP